MINFIQKSFVNKKIYSLLVEGRDYTFLSVQLAESLEEAFILAKKEFFKKSPGSEESMLGARIGLFEIKEIPELFFGQDIQQAINSSDIRQVVSAIDELKKGEVQKNGELRNQDIKKKLDVKPSEGMTQEMRSLEKNKFIKFLIDNKNTEILEKNKNLFTENEIKYIQEKIAENKNKK